MRPKPPIPHKLPPRVYTGCPRVYPGYTPVPGSTSQIGGRLAERRANTQPLFKHSGSAVFSESPLSVGCQSAALRLHFPMTVAPHAPQTANPSQVAPQGVHRVSQGIPRVYPGYTPVPRSTSQVGGCLEILEYSYNAAGIRDNSGAGVCHGSGAGVRDNCGADLNNKAVIS